ncbi:MAG TPA: DHHA1 domain-containing protein, partial [Bryobacteraceae bacterium]|nr:DHHA1 domain-containing protein [Bryobacteraceae bacterium]
AVGFEDAASGPALRKPSEREGELRIITIDGFDRSACGGTHVSATGEIGPILIRKVERAHQSVRLEFLCGMRAVRRARADFEALTKIARVFSSPLDETPAIAASQTEALAASEKARRKLAVELAQVRGRELYAAAPPASDGLRRHELRIAKGALDDEVRATAQGFAANPKALFLAIAEEPPSLLLAVSADSGIHAGNVLKAALSAKGGRGGGSQNMGQGSVPSREKLEAVRSALP